MNVSWRGMNFQTNKRAHTNRLGRRCIAFKGCTCSTRSSFGVPSSARTHIIDSRGNVVITTAFSGRDRDSGRGSRQPAQSTSVPDAQTEQTNSFLCLEGLQTNGKAAHSYTDELATKIRNFETSQISVITAESFSEFSVAAELRATAFYDDLEARQALPFPSRFLATFRREFAQRECLALKERTAHFTGTLRRCLCLMARLPDLGLVGCLDISARVGPCGSQVNGLCIPDNEEYVYIDNVAVDERARRLGSASAMLEASSEIALQWGAGFVYTHAHADNIAARRLYHTYGFRAPKGSRLADILPPGKVTPWVSPRLAGLILLRAPLPLVRQSPGNEDTTDCKCVCGAIFDNCEKCVCGLV